MELEDISNLLNVNSIIINGESKSGKVTFLLYLLKFLFKEKAIMFSSQESYLFQRKIDSLKTQYLQFSDLDGFFNTYFLSDNWQEYKQRYGYDFFILELEHLIEMSQEKIIVIHRIGQFFEFQDRFEIDYVYKSLVKIATAQNKKIIFLTESTNQNFDYIKRVSEELMDVSITIASNENSERILTLRDIVKNREYPRLNFRNSDNNFILDFNEMTKEIEENKVNNVLIAELDHLHDNIREICTYIFNKPNFEVSYADTLQGILQEVFISPDIVIVLMQRTEENFETIASIKKQLPSTKIIAILDQNFVRTEDMQEAYNNGCNELFGTNLSLESLILTCQKSAHTLFYTQALESLNPYNNILDTLEEFKALGRTCVEKSLFFTAFTIESKTNFSKILKTSRSNDYLYQTEHKLYYIAVNTMPKDINKIVNYYQNKHSDLEISCMWEPINHESFDGCVS